MVVVVVLVVLTVCVRSPSFHTSTDEEAQHHLPVCAPLQSWSNTKFVFAHLLGVYSCQPTSLSPHASA